MPQIHIYRGLPGSGKTTLARKEHPDALCINIEDNFSYRGGRYRYNRQDHNLWQSDSSYRYAKEDILRHLQRYEYDIVICEVFHTRDHLHWLWSIFYDHMNWADKIGISAGIHANITTVYGRFGSTHNVNPDHLKYMRESWEDTDYLQNLIKQCPRTSRLGNWYSFKEVDTRWSKTPVKLPAAHMNSTTAPPEHNLKDALTFSKDWVQLRHRKSWL